MKTFFRHFAEIAVMLAAVFAFTTLILEISGASAMEAYYHIFRGSLGSWVRLGHVIKAWIPMTLCSCGLLCTFRIGLWNIGVEGQMMMGAVFTTYLLRLGAGSNMPVLFLIFAFIAGAAGGGLWAWIAGLLKTKGGVNEIFAGLGMNFVAQGIVLWLIFGLWKRPGIASMSGTELFPPELWLSHLTAVRFSPAALLLALLAVVLTALMLRYTHIGLNLRAIGSNPRAAYLLGLKPGRYILLAMLFAGGLAGIAGTIQVSDVYHRLLPAISSNYGYLSLLVVMLSDYNIRVIPAVAFFFACLNVGSIQLPMMLQLDSSLSGVIQGVLVLATLAVQAWKSEVRN
jgi:simple sugar transport system permease protein